MTSDEQRELWHLVWQARDYIDVIEAYRSGAPMDYEVVAMERDALASIANKVDGMLGLTAALGEPRNRALPSQHT